MYRYWWRHYVYLCDIFEIGQHRQSIWFLRPHHWTLNVNSVWSDIRHATNLLQVLQVVRYLLYSYSNNIYGKLMSERHSIDRREWGTTKSGIQTTATAWILRGVHNSKDEESSFRSYYRQNLLLQICFGRIIHRDTHCSTLDDDIGSDYGNYFDTA